METEPPAVSQPHPIKPHHHDRNLDVMEEACRAVGLDYWRERRIWRGPSWVVPDLVLGDTVVELKTYKTELQAGITRLHHYRKVLREYDRFVLVMPLFTDHGRRSVARQGFFAVSVEEWPDWVTQELAA